MNTIQRQPVITAGTVSGIILAVWAVLETTAILKDMDEGTREALRTLVLLVVPIISAAIASRFVTPTGSPRLDENQTVVLPDGSQGTVTRA